MGGRPRGPDRDSGARRPAAEHRPAAAHLAGVTLRSLTRALSASSRRHGRRIVRKLVATGCVLVGCGWLAGAATWSNLNATTTVGGEPFSAASDWGPPAAPTAVTTTPGDGKVAVSWTAPSSIGGSTISGYTATASPSGQTCSTTAATSCTITGLTDGSTQSITVTATNSYGTGAASSAVSATAYPAALFTAANGFSLWLDGADTSTLYSGLELHRCGERRRIGRLLEGQERGRRELHAADVGQPAGAGHAERVGRDRLHQRQPGLELDQRHQTPIRRCSLPCNPRRPRAGGRCSSVRPAATSASAKPAARAAASSAARTAMTGRSTPARRRWIGATGFRPPGHRWARRRSSPTRRPARRASRRASPPPSPERLHARDAW